MIFQTKKSVFQTKKPSLASCTDADGESPLGFQSFGADSAFSSSTIFLSNYRSGVEFEVKMVSFILFRL